jgi:hypothetical protein
MRILLEGELLYLQTIQYRCFNGSIVLNTNRHTMSGSILMDGSPKKGKSKLNGDKNKVDMRLNMGSGILDSQVENPDIKYVPCSLML